MEFITIARLTPFLFLTHPIKRIQRRRLKRPYVIFISYLKLTQNSNLSRIQYLLLLKAIIKLPAKNTIQLSNQKSLGLSDFDLPDKIRFSIKDGLLYLLMDENEDHKFILEREK